MQDVMDGAGDLSLMIYLVVGVHTLSLLASSRVAHDNATDNHYPDQHNTQYTKHSRLTYSGSESGSNLDREVLNPSPCG